MPKKFIERFKRIDELIALRATGNKAELADKLDISESTLYEFLKVLKELGAPIDYNQERCSYFFTEKGRIEIRFKKE
jgi:predicted DNA-binding transcriptional regulator YafY